MRILRSIPFVAWVACMGLCAIAAGAAPARETKPRSDVPVVHNPAEPARGDWEIRAVEKWRAGGEDDTVLFGAVMDVDVAPDGTTYILDAQQSTVHVIAPDGRYVRRMGRAGQGPGEFTFPVSMCVDDTGNVYVASSMTRRIVRFAPTGEPLDACAIPSPGSGDEASGESGAGTTLVTRVDFARGALVLGIQATEITPGGVSAHSRTVRAKCDGTILAKYPATEHEIRMNLSALEFNEEANAGPLVSVARDGRVFVCDTWADYRILVLAPDGTPERVIERDFEPLRRTDEEKSRAEEAMRSQFANLPVQVSVHVSDVFRSVAGMLARDDGSLWVVPAQRPESLPEGVAGVYDEFDSEGRFVRRVFLAVDASRTRDGVYPAGDRVVVVRGLNALVKGWLKSLQPAAASTIPDDENADTSEDGTVIGYAMRPATRSATH